MDNLTKKNKSTGHLYILIATLVILLSPVISQDDPSFPLKIQADISRLASIKNISPNGPEIYERLTTFYIPAVIKHLEDTFDTYDVTSFTMSSTPCNGMDITELSKKTIEAGFLIIFNYDSLSADYVAYAGTCKIQTTTKRPLVSFVYVNTRNLNFISDSRVETVFGTILHEIIHTMGFTSFYLQGFYDRQAKISRPIADVVESSTDYPIRIKTPQLKTWVNNHLDCNEDLSVPLENIESAGSGGSHFETFVMGNEMLNPSTFYNTVYTGATTAYIESMGFFKVKLPKTKMDETLAWGYKAGCNVLKDG